MILRAWNIVQLLRLIFNLGRSLLWIVAFDMFGCIVASTYKCNYEKYHSEKLLIKINRYGLGSGAVAFHSGSSVIGWV